MVHRYTYCPPTFQRDTDEDNIGNACDIDMDGDGELNAVDLCPVDKIPEDKDRDGDRVGDRCDNCKET